MENKKKVLRLIKYENGFLNPIKLYTGPGGGAYAPFEIPLVFDPENDKVDVEIEIYEIKKIIKTSFKELKEKRGS